MSNRRSRWGQSTAVTSMKQTNAQRGSSRRNVATATMSAALTPSVSSPLVTAWPVTAPGRPAAMASPRDSTVSSLMSSPLDGPDAPDLLLQQQHAVQQRLGRGRTARDIDVHRHDAVTAAHNGIRVVVVAAAV